jgi:hypothetical protein
MKQLLIEQISTIQVPKPTLIESIGKNDGKLIVRDVLLQRADRPNRNKRVYPKNILDKALNEYFQKINEKRAFSELDHPNGELANVISLKNVCQVIQNAWWKNDEIRGDVEILNTPSGNIVKEILLAGYRVGQSSRGLGSVEELHEGDDPDLVEVQDDFEFLTLADCVSDPSTHNADMVLGEGKVRTVKKESNVDILIRDILCEMSGICCFK